MPGKRWKILFTVVWFNAAVFTTGAVDIERFEHLNTKDGLSQNSVLSAFCDHRGFLWFGTMNGLNRYDGYEFKIYKAVPGEKYSLSNNRITDIWEDSALFLWQ
ncbi:MAG TPA: two-component regulator propeller domain-containing protein, partial [Bacteroidales bacterium]|nr:two-component regulator propeller domain-containing protein [Bacteroidales bacterium]